MRNSDIPDVIPPRTRVRLVRADSSTPGWQGRTGEVFRVGYYCRGCGLGCVWLVDAAGEYVETTDREFLLRYFEILELSDETDFFGDNRPLLEAETE